MSQKNLAIRARDVHMLLISLLWTTLFTNIIELLHHTRDKIRKRLSRCQQENSITNNIWQFLPHLSQSFGIIQRNTQSNRHARHDAKVNLRGEVTFLSTSCQSWNAYKMLSMLICNYENRDVILQIRRMENANRRSLFLLIRTSLLKTLKIWLQKCDLD